MRIWDNHLQLGVKESKHFLKNRLNRIETVLESDPPINHQNNVVQLSCVVDQKEVPFSQPWVSWHQVCHGLQAAVYEWHVNIMSWTECTSTWTEASKEYDCTSFYFYHSLSFLNLHLRIQTGEELLPALPRAFRGILFFWWSYCRVASQKGIRDDHLKPWPHPSPPISGTLRVHKWEAKLIKIT